MILRNILQRRFLIFFFFSFVLWISLFHRFLSGQLALFMDAGPYYDHIKFYIDNIIKGVYPLWDPTWEHGSPNDFFLRRICPYNPFFLLILFFKFLGLTYTQAYLFYLATYFFVGMIGFYLVSKSLFQDKVAALFSFILLLFSSLGTRLFDSFLVFIIAPLIWFFYFLVAFSKKERKYDFLGMIFSLMIAVTTYIPFHFLTIILFFFLSYVICYFKDFKKFLRQYVRFIKANKFFVIFCALLLILALLPGTLFYVKANHGEFVMPWRQTDTNVKNALTVDSRGPVWWAILEEILYSNAFLENLTQFQLQVFYLPIFVYIILAIGVVLRNNRRLIFFSLWGFLLFLLSIPEGVVYHFLSAHVFYFKYFKNLQFFLWIGILPISILFAVEQFRVFINYQVTSRGKKILLLIYLLLIHGGFAFFIFLQKNAIISSYLVIFCSFIFFVLYFQKKVVYGSTMFLTLLFICTVLQPVETYIYLSKNSEKAPVNGYTYDQPYMQFSFVPDRKNPYLVEHPNINALDLPQQHSSLIYFGTRWYHFLRENLNEYVFVEYVRHKFRIYDHVELVRDDAIDIKRIENSFLKNENVAFLSNEDDSQIPQISNQSHSLLAQEVEGNSDQFRVLKYDSNSIQFRTSFDQEKFLVYSDNFYSGWRVFINGKEVKLWRANIAFKGIFLPKGENVVSLRFGSAGYYVFNIFLIGTFYSIFFYLLWQGGSLFLMRRRLDGLKI